MRKVHIVILFMLISITAFAQTTIKGSVVDANGEPLPTATVKVVGKALGTNTDFDGNFNLTVNQEPPFSIKISLIGYAAETYEITQNNQIISATLNENETALDEVVVSASRTPERIMESPVTVERMDARSIKNTSSPTFYDGLENLKGVDVNTNSLSFKSVNTRGFATFSNTRFVQLVDGMDNSSPALNFTLGNLLGMNELDVNTVELLPGASSALYGANAFNGILFMTSKSPFDDQGVSVYLKSGITSQEAAGDNQFYDVGARFAHAFSDKFAAKASIGYLQGQDWWATDYNEYDDDGNITGFTRENPGYDGLNIYGDEVGTTLNFDQIFSDASGLPVSNFFGTDYVSRTGYNDVDLMNNDVESVKFDAALHFRPWEDDKEIIVNSKVGFGNTIYQGTNRYSLTNFFMQQHKVEFKGKNFFLRGYITDESAGDSYDTRFAAINVNRSWKGDTEWFTDYAGAYIGAFSAGATEAVAHQQARAFADTGRLIPGTPSFQEAFDLITSDGDLTTGAKFTDKSQIKHADVNYNFGDLMNVNNLEIQLGGSSRGYKLNSEGTIYTDYDGAIKYNEFGAYTQAQYKMMDERLKLTGSLRYDKSELFDGNFSPRLSIAYAMGEAKNHNFRASFQTGFRNPTTQDLYIGLDAGSAFLVGGSEDNLNRYNTRPITYSTDGGTNFETTSLNGSLAYTNAYSANGFLNGDVSQEFTAFVESEQVTAYEIGYRGKINKFTIDLNGYYNDYDGFISNKNVLVPLYGNVSDGSALAAMALGNFRVFQLYTNSQADVSSYGATLGVNTSIGNGFKLGINYAYADLDFDQASDPDFEAQFNTPEHKVKFSFGNAKVYKNFGFNVNCRWSDAYKWESTFQNGMIHARTVVDAQINYAAPKWKSLFKIGGSNIGGDEYFSAPGAGSIGSQYFASWTINP